MLKRRSWEQRSEAANESDRRDPILTAQSTHARAQTLVSCFSTSSRRSKMAPKIY